jgi:hypothetical protein
MNMNLNRLETTTQYLRKQLNGEFLQKTIDAKALSVLQIRYFNS